MDNTLLGWIVRIVIGLIGGLLADSLVKGIELPTIGKILVGIIGGVLFGWLFGDLLFASSAPAGSITWWLVNIVASMLGAIIILWIIKALRRA